MLRATKATATLASLAIAGSVGVVGLLLHEPPQAEVADSSSTPSTVDSTSSDAAAESPGVAQGAVPEFGGNRGKLIAQQDAERAEAARVLVLPAGTQFGPPETFVEPSAWYEDGFFASLMAADWQCAWLSTGVQQADAGDLDAVAETVAILHSFTSTEYASSFPDYDYFLEEFVDPLLEGDTVGADSYLPLNCLESTRVD